jgi:hypothetical protein
MLKSIVCGVAMTLGLFVQAADEDTPDKVMKDQIVIMSEMCDVLESVKDKESAEKAKPKLEALVKKAKTIEARVQKLKVNDLPKEQKEALEKKYKEEMQKTATRFFAAATKLSQDKDLAGVLKALEAGRDEKTGEIIKEMLTVFKELTAILDSVQDKETAQQAKPKLEALLNKVKELKVRGKTFNLKGVPQEKIEELKAASQKFEASLKKVNENAEAVKELQDVLKDLRKD